MSVGPLLPPPRPGHRDLPEGTGYEAPSFTLLEGKRAVAPMTGREAVLSSVLIHAILVIVLIVTPAHLFDPGSETPALLAFAQRPDEDRIPMAFVQDRDRLPEPNPEARMGSDRDRRRGQEEQPDDPAQAGPFSRGNTPAMIAEGPLGPAPQAPAPSANGAEAPPSPPEEPAAPAEPSPEESDPGRTKREVESFDVDAYLGRLGVPSPSKGAEEERGDEELREKGNRLRRALSSMGASGSLGEGGGAPYRFDNPTAGLSTPYGTLSFDTKGFDWGDYARRIYWIIWYNWHSRLPPAVYTGWRGAVTVRFVIEKDGTLSTIDILDESGVPAYDSAAVLALEASSPLPPLPSSFPAEREGVTARFLYNMRR